MSFFAVKGLRKAVTNDKKDKKAPERVLFDDLSFELSAGQTLAIEGTSGCGKTTLFRLISGLDKVETGTITLNGMTQKHLGLPEWRTKVAYVPQKVVTFEGTPADMLQTFQKFAAQQKLKKHRERQEEKEIKDEKQMDLGLEAICTSFKLSTALITSDWNRLSGGEHQRMMLALTIALKPDVLLLDEPTSALDPDTTLAVENFLTQLPMIKLWITHSPQQAERVGDWNLKFPGPVLTQNKARMGSGEGRRIGVEDGEVLSPLSKSESLVGGGGGGELSPLITTE